MPTTGVALFSTMGCNSVLRHFYSALFQPIVAEVTVQGTVAKKCRSTQDKWKIRAKLGTNGRSKLVQNLLFRWSKNKTKINWGCTLNEKLKSVPKMQEKSYKKKPSIEIESLESSF